MVAKNSKKYQLDIRSMTQVFTAGVIGIVSIYASNTQVFDAILKDYINPQAFSVVTIVLAYMMKKLLTDYSKK